MAPSPDQSSESHKSSKPIIEIKIENNYRSNEFVKKDSENVTDISHFSRFFYENSGFFRSENQHIILVDYEQKSH